MEAAPLSLHEPALSERPAPATVSQRAVMSLIVPLIVSLGVVGQAISTNMPVPPLQWLNITDLIQGTSAPPLKYPSIGYDDTSRSLLLFGGESSSGILTSQTFLCVHRCASFRRSSSA